jgi:hydrogenase small subunit
MRFNEGVAWPVSIGHPCVGCTERLIFNTAIADKAVVVDPDAPSWFPPAKPVYQGKPAGVIGAAVVGLVAGGAIGYATGKGSAGLPDDEESK